MKKSLYLILAMVLLVVSLPAFAKGVPSKTTQDLAVVTSVTTSTGVVPSSDFAIQPAKQSEAANKELAKIVQFVTANQTAPIKYFDTAVQEKVAAALPVGTDIDNLEMNEFAPVSVENYSEDYGDITTSFTFATQYADGQALVAMLGIVTGTAADGSPIIEWIPLEANVVDGAVNVVFTQDALAAMQGNDCMIAMLSETAA